MHWCGSGDPADRISRQHDVAGSTAAVVVSTARGGLDRGRSRQRRAAGHDAGRLLGGRYQVGELLGYGGMAEVHRGRDLRLGRDVAIKVLRTDLARDDTFQVRFRREAQNAASLNHPAIVAVYDTGEERGAGGERCRTSSWSSSTAAPCKDVLAAEGRLMPRRALEIIADDLRRAGVQPPARHHPPRHQARQRDADARPARSR